MLAEKLGMTVGQLLATITAKELAEWHYYFQIISEQEFKARQEQQTLSNMRRAKQQRGR